MSQTPISPTPGVTTHANVLTILNANSSDAESRLAAIEGVTGVHTDFSSDITDADSRITNIENTTGSFSLTGHQHVVADITDYVDFSSDITALETKTLQQTISSVSGVLTLDSSLGGNATTELTEDITGFVINNAASGDSGLVLVTQDNTSSWTFSTQQSVLAGDLTEISNITASGIGLATVGWYHDGADEHLYVSDST